MQSCPPPCLGVKADDPAAFLQAKHAASLFPCPKELLISHAADFRVPRKCFEMANPAGKWLH